MIQRLISFISRSKWYLLVIALTIPTFTSILRSGTFPIHDDLQAMRVYQMELCFKSLQFPCRWVPDMGYQYGYPQFEYYGPLPYYIMTASRFFHLPLFDSVKLGFILPLILGNLTMFLLASSLFGNFGGLLSAIAYGYSPYRASDLYSRGAMGETWAYVFLPLILYSVVSLYRNPTLKKSTFLGLSLALLLVTHNISSLMFMPMIALIALGLITFGKNKPAFLKYGILAIVWSIAMSATFILPVIFEKGYAHTESLTQGYFNYLAHFVSLKQLFVSTFWSYGSSDIGPTDDLSFFIGPIHLFLLAVTLSVIVINYFRRKIKLDSYITMLSAMLFLASVFMVHEKSTFIWKAIPILSYLQFPWRFLVTANFFICLSSGYFLNYLKAGSRNILLIVLGVLVIFFNVSYFRPREWYHQTIWEKFSGLSWDKQLTISIFDYLPIYAKFPPAKPAPTYPYAKDTKVSILDYRHESSTISFSTKSTSNAQFTLPQYDFPGWEVRLDDKIIPHNHDNDLGLISFYLPDGDHRINAVLKDTPVRLVGDILTLVFLPLGIYICLKKI